MTVLPQCRSGTVICVASGPSLAPDDVAYVRDKGTVIAINDAVQLAPWADVLYSSDSAWWAKHRYMRDFRGLRVTVDRTQWHKHLRTPSSEHGVIVLRNTGRSGIEFAPDGLRTAINSGGAAINLAVHLKAKRIVLLGYDMGPMKGRYHFCDDPNSPTRNTSAYATFRQLIGTMADPLAKAGISVVNCSRHTALTCFPRMSLDAALPQAMAVAS